MIAAPTARRPAADPDTLRAGLMRVHPLRVGQAVRLARPEFGAAACWRRRDLGRAPAAVVREVGVYVPAPRRADDEPPPPRYQALVRFEPPRDPRYRDVRDEWRWTEELDPTEERI